jgi:hypothetical protein
LPLLFRRNVYAALPGEPTTNNLLVMLMEAPKESPAVPSEAFTLARRTNTPVESRSKTYTTLGAVLRDPACEQRAPFVTQRDRKAVHAISRGRREGLRVPEQSGAALEYVRGIPASNHEHAIAERDRATEITLRRGIGRGQPLDLLPAGCRQIQNDDMAVVARAGNTYERDIVADATASPKPKSWNSPGECIDVAITEFCYQRVFRQGGQCSWCDRDGRKCCDIRDHTSPYGHRAHVCLPVPAAVEAHVECASDMPRSLSYRSLQRDRCAAHHCENRCAVFLQSLSVAPHGC